MEKYHIMQQFPLDVEKSKSLYREQAKRFQARDCYRNIYKAITNHISDVGTDGWKVAYGYYSCKECPRWLLRHCFILDQEDHVIDPTIFTHKDKSTCHEYFVLFAFDSYRDYFAAVEESDYYPSLDHRYHALSKEAWEWARQNGYVLSG